MEISSETEQNFLVFFVPFFCVCRLVHLKEMKRSSSTHQLCLIKQIYNAVRCSVCFCVIVIQTWTRRKCEEKREIFFHHRHSPHGFFSFSLWEMRYIDVYELKVEWEQAWWRSWRCKWLMLICIVPLRALASVKSIITWMYRAINHTHKHFLASPTVPPLCHLLLHETQRRSFTLERAIQSAHGVMCWCFIFNLL